ncbi:hypothetical protein KIK06_23450 [Nocardiopsis sp. EMB25]|uniref:hypothetical protein n=1 Tax=Nocardiopsis sp. EMB25 TaxID=2835867 RepID=UPI0022852BB2|nr:hypothetical protein [Nocardiopsis sp. EMB25]MCY9786843.1 hypothetical protein [Nocardiopsis sp. EMB25]
MRTLKARLTASCKALRDVVARAWNTFTLAVHAIHHGRYARGGILPTGPSYARNITSRPERVTAHPHQGEGEFTPLNRT